MPGADPLRSWSWTSPYGRRELRIYQEQVVVVDDASRPSRSSRSLADAFARPDLLFVRELGDYFAIVRALAQLLDADALPDHRARRRLVFWQAYDPERLDATTYQYTEHWTSQSGAQVQASLGPFGMTVAASRPYETDQLYLPDDVFFYGPPVIGMARDAREDIRDRLLGALVAGCALDPGDAFPTFDYDAMPERRWTFNQAHDGAEDAALRGAVVFRGYQFGRDMGYSHYPVERVWTKAPDVRLSVPAPIEAELREALSRAKR